MDGFDDLEDTILEEFTRDKTSVSSLVDSVTQLLSDCPSAKRKARRIGIQFGTKLDEKLGEILQLKTEYITAVKALCNESSSKQKAAISTEDSEVEGNDSRARGKVKLKASAKERKHVRSAKTEERGNYVGLFGSASASTHVHSATEDVPTQWERCLKEAGILKPAKRSFAERGFFSVDEVRPFFKRPKFLASVGGITLEQAELLIAVINRPAEDASTGASSHSSHSCSRRKRKHKTGRSERRDSGRTHRRRASDALQSQSSASESELQSERSHRDSRSRRDSRSGSDSRSRSRSHSRKRRGTDKKRERRRVEERVDSGITSERRHRGRHRDGSEERRQKKHRSSTEKKSKRSRREASPPPALEPGTTERQKKRRSRIPVKPEIHSRSLSTESSPRSVRQSPRHSRRSAAKPFVESMRKSLESSSSKGSGRNYRNAFDRGEDEERDDADSMQTQHDDDSRDELDEELDTGRKKRRRRLSSKKQDAVEMESKSRRRRKQRLGEDENEYDDDGSVPVSILQVRVSSSTHSSTVRKRKRRRDEAQADDIDSEQRDVDPVNSEEEDSEWQQQNDEDISETLTEEEFDDDAKKSTAKKTRTQSFTQAPSTGPRGRRRASASSSLTQTASSVSSTREPPSKKRKKTATRSVRVVAEKLPQRELFDWDDFNRRLQNVLDRYNALMKERDPDFVAIDFSQVEVPSTAEFKCTAPKCGEAFKYAMELKRHKTRFHDTPPHIKCPVDGCTCAYRVEAIFDIHQRKGHLGDEQPTDKSEECSEETKSSEKFD